jgi:hypothetical protein
LPQSLDGFKIPISDSICLYRDTSDWKKKKKVMGEKQVSNQCKETPLADFTN